MDVGKKIKDIRTSRKMTAKELSEKCGVPEKSIYKIESGGVKDPRISSVVSIAKGLGCSVDELISEIDIDVTTMQMTALLNNSIDTTEVEKDYLKFRIEEFRRRESIKRLMVENENLPEDVAEDWVIKRKLEMTINRTNEEERLLKHLDSLFGSTEVHTKV